MVSSKAKTVEAYLAELPEDRRTAIAAVREVILANLPDGYEESMQYGMIGYSIPLSRYPVTYNRQPLAYAGLASQKNYMTLYLMDVYAESETERWFKAEFEKSGKKLNMGKSCVYFRKADDLPLALIGKTIARTSVADYIARYEVSRGIGAKG